VEAVEVVEAVEREMVPFYQEGDEQRLKSFTQGGKIDTEEANRYRRGK
jgi:hypothetical protein